MTSAEQEEIDNLIDKLETDEVQSQLLPGFQKEFSGNIAEKWQKNRHLSAREIEILTDIVQRYDAGSKPSNFSKRRYEGYTKDK